MNTCTHHILAQSDMGVEYNDCICAEGKAPQQIWRWGSSNAGVLGNEENFFIDNAPRSTLILLGSYLLLKKN